MQSLLILIPVLILGSIFIYQKSLETPPYQPVTTLFSTPTTAPTISPTITPHPLPNQKTLINGYHTFQTFNNCGPAALSMALSYHGITKTQQELGQALRPYQHPKGINDDKSVTLEELGEYAKQFDLLPYHRPNGSIELIQQFINADIPVLTRTLLHTNDDIGHFRVIKGFDSRGELLIQDDSLQGHNLSYSYDDFLALWKPFNFEYLVLAPKDKISRVENILADNLDSKTAWERALTHAQSELSQNPSDVYAELNVSLAHYHLGNFQDSINAYEHAAPKLPMRTLWYQIEPILAYYKTGQYDKVFTITNEIFARENPSFSELYFIRSQIFQKQEKVQEAENELELAKKYNIHYPVHLLKL